MKTVLQLKQVTKIYPGVVALDGVSLDIREGEVHALMGENGAGKSTIIKVISGAIRPDGGTIEVDGKAVRTMTPGAARQLGIGVIYQEFNLVNSMSVVENIFLGQHIGSAVSPDFGLMRQKARAIFEEFGVDIDVDSMVGTLSPAKMQLVEIAKALSQNARLLIMDEPSASISIADVAVLFQIIRTLKSKNVAIIYISHRMDEVFEIADRVTVLRNGKYVNTKMLSEVSRSGLIAMMVGRELNEYYPPRSTPIGETVFEVRGLSGNGVRDISFSLRRGEVLGLAGLVGAGRTELAKVVYGAEKMEQGQILVDHTPVTVRSPREALRHGIAYIPEDRKQEGVFLDFPIEWNINIMGLKQNSRHMVLSKGLLREISTRFFERLNIIAPSDRQYVRNLSGGNQQKVALAKSLVVEPRIIIFDEPTRGIDVGAKQEIYQLMNGLAEQGVSIIMISSEMEELIGMSDRILVMHEGRLSGELRKEAFDQQHILALASGIIPKEAEH